MTEATKTKRTVNRSAAYPGISLEEAVEATKLLRNNLGAGPYSRESAAQALGYAGVNGASSTKVAACVHFGLLSRDGNVYRQSELAQKLFVFVSDDEKQEALRAAVRKPALYTKLIDAYNGSALPNMLSNILARNYNITERVAKDAAAAFLKSAEYAGVLKNGVLKFSEPKETESLQVLRAEPPVVKAGSSVTSQTSAPQTQTSTLSPALPQDYLPVEIPGTGIKILFPSKFAYDLSTGAFKTGIEALAGNARGKKAETNDDKQFNSAQE